MSASESVCPTYQEVQEAVERLASTQNLFEVNAHWDQSLACKKRVLFDTFKGRNAARAAAKQSAPQSGNTSSESPTPMERAQLGRAGAKAFNDQLDRYVPPKTHNKTGHTFEAITVEQPGRPSVAVKALENGKSPKKTVLYFHGGGYMLDLPSCGATYNDFAVTLSDQLEARVFLLDYRVRPEHPLEASLEDAVTVYCSLLDQGVDPTTILLAGDSAGGGLVARLLLWCKAHQQPMPGGAIMISPWLDLTNSGDSMQRNAKTALCVTPDAMEAFTPIIVGEADPADPMISPLFGDYGGFPPLFYTVGGREIFEDDTWRDVEKANGQGVKTSVVRFEDGIHIYPIYLRFLPEAHTALDAMMEWVRDL